MNADPRPDVEKVVSILRSGKEPLDPCWVNRNKVSQLHICAMRNEAALVQKLIAMPGGKEEASMRGGNDVILTNHDVMRELCFSFALHCSFYDDVIVMEGDPRKYAMTS